MAINLGGAVGEQEVDANWLKDNKPRPPKSASSGGSSSGGSYGGGGGGSYGGGGGGGGGGAAPATSSKAEARAVLFAGLASILGRKPTKSEINAYHKALGIFETENADGGISADMKTQMMSDFVDDDPDLRAERRGYEVATKYFSAFAKAIQSPVSI